MDSMGKHRRVAVLLVIFSLLPPASAFCFDLGIGLKAGATVPWYLGTGYQDWAAWSNIAPIEKIGFSGGGFITIGIFDFLAIQPEVFFSQLGGRAGNGSITLNDWWNGIDVSILLKARTRPNERGIFDFFAGPDLLIKRGNVSSDLKDSSGNVIAWAVADEASLRIPILGLVIGLGIEFPIGPFFLTMDARYSVALQSRFKDSAGLGPWIQNSVQLMFGAGLVLVGK